MTAQHTLMKNLSRATLSISIAVALSACGGGTKPTQSAPTVVGSTTTTTTTGTTTTGTGTTTTGTTGTGTTTTGTTGTGTTTTGTTGTGTTTTGTTGTGTTTTGTTGTGTTTTGTGTGTGTTTTGTAPLPGGTTGEPAATVTSPPLGNYQFVNTNDTTSAVQSFTGLGIKVGILDSGVNLNNPSINLVNPIAPGPYPSRITASYNFTSATSSDGNGHGTAVAMTLGGATAGRYWQGGIASNSFMYSARIVDDSGLVAEGSYEQANTQLMSLGVQIFNNSWGDNVAITDAAKLTAATNYSAARTSYDQVVGGGGLVVFQAGDAAGSSVDTQAGLPYYFPELTKGWLAVVATDPTKGNAIASYSNQCGLAAQWCMAAPGTMDVPTTSDTSASGSAPASYQEWKGTSMATAIVSSAAAAVWQQFPWMTAEQVRLSLLTTATDLGASGVDPVYGWGQLNVANAVNGPGQLAFGDETFNVTQNAVFSNNISGTGSLIKQGNATLNLTGNNTYTGQTQIALGELDDNGSLASSVAISSAGTFVGNGPVGGAVDNQGWIYNPKGLLTIGGNYTSSANSSMVAMLGKPYAIGGSAVLGGALYVNAPSGYVVKAQETLLTAPGGVTGTFSTINQPSATLTVTPVYEAADVKLNVSQATVASMPVATASASTAVAATSVDSGFASANAMVASSAPLAASQQTFVASMAGFQRISDLAVLKASLNSLSGAAYADSKTTELDADSVVGHLLTGRLADVASGQNAGAWASASSGSNTVGGNGYQTGNNSLDVAAAGLDVPVGDGNIGIAATWLRNNGNVSDMGGHVRGTSPGLALYGSVLQDNWYLRGDISQSWSQNTVERYVTTGSAAAAATATTHGRLTAATAEFGAPLHMGEQIITPIVQAGYARLTQDGFTEQGGAGVGLAGSASTLHETTAGVGARYSFTFHMSGMPIELQGDLMQQWVLNHPDSGFTASFNGAPGSTFLVAGSPLDRQSTWAGIGLVAHHGEHLTFMLRDDERFASHDRAHQFTAAVRYTF